MVHEKLDVKDLMSERLACLPPVVRLMDLSSILRGDCHGAFPITSDAVIGGPTESPIKLEGVVTRTQILRAVKYRVGFIKMVGYDSAPTNILPSQYFAALSVYMYHGDTGYIIYTCGVGYSVCSCIQGAVMCFLDRCGSVATRKIVENLSRKCDCIFHLYASYTNSVHQPRDCDLPGMVINTIWTSILRNIVGKSDFRFSCASRLGPIVYFPESEW